MKRLLLLPYLMSVLLAVSLAACEKQKPADVPKPTATSPMDSSTSPSSPIAGASDPSVPPATTAAAPSGATADHKRSGDPQTEMTKQEESSAMPKPSQANDHSTTAIDPKK